MTYHSGIDIASWNISAERYDDDDPIGTRDIESYSRQLGRVGAQIIAIQEGIREPIPDTEASYYSSLEHLALLRAMQKAAEVSFFSSPPGNGCGNTIGTLVSSGTDVDVETIHLPAPSFELKFVSTGEPATPHDRPAIITRTQGLTVVNAHHLPLERFGYSYTDGKAGSEYARELDQVYLEALQKDEYVVMAGDFNTDDSTVTFPELSRYHSLRSALPRGKTMRRWDNSPDQLLHSHTLAARGGRIHVAPSDHQLISATFYES